MSTVSTSSGRPVSLQLQEKGFRGDAYVEKRRMQEIERVASFSTFPEDNTSSPFTLARSGFVYSGKGSRVQCPVCQFTLENPTRGDNPAEEHRKKSPECLLANQVADVNNSFQLLGPSSSEVSGCSQALQDVYISASRRLQGGMNRDSEVPEQPNMCLSLSVRVDRQNPDYELLRRERIRLDTFYDWPSSANACPEALAREGFFFTGSTDRVRCAFCRSSLHSWAPGDDPTEEHRKHYPRCSFVRNLDVGNVRIEDDVRVENSGQDLLSLTGAVGTNASAGQTASELHSLEAFMSTPTARAAMEMGFPEENVKQVIQQHLTETGELFASAESLVERLLSSGVNQSYNGSATQKNTTSSTSIATTSACATSSSINLSLPNFIQYHDAFSSPATAATSAVSSSSTFVSFPSALIGASSASATAATSQSAAFASAGAESETRTGDERNEETGIPQSESSKKVNSTKKRRRALKKEKMAASVFGGSSSSQAVSNELQAVSSETSSATSTSSLNENAGSVVDPEEDQLLEENSRLKEARTCKVCMDKEVNTVFLPCGHLICCDNCSPRIRNCPLCRTLIRGTVKTYLS